MKRLVALFAAAALLFTSSAFAADAAKPKRVPKVQIALLLDNSGSMGGLLNQARTQMWKVVNEFAHASQHGKPVRLEIALYEYGNGVVRHSPLTSNLDAISEQLFGLQIAGGDEYCGQVIQSAVRELEWSGDPDDLKLIYIAGNEPFTQGPVNYEVAAKEAVKKGIAVNTILCGENDPTWQAGALAGHGNFLTINQNAMVAQVTAPQDAELAKLGMQLNRTYIAYGASGGEAKERQAKMDESAQIAAPAAAAERAIAKAGRNYDNSGWDLVDATKNGQVAVGGLKDAELPPELRGKSEKEQKAVIEAKAKEREEIQKKIATLTAERQKFLAEEQKKAAAKGDTTFDGALSESIHKNAAAKSISFE